jgi:hypothetical protein
MLNESPFRYGRHGRLMLWCAVAGGSSSLLGLLFGDASAPIRGALFGLCLSLGLAGLNLVSQRRLNAGQPPTWSAAVAGGALSGLLAGTALGLFNWWGRAWIVPAGELPVPEPPAGLAALGLGLCYGLALHLAYACRWRFAIGRKGRTILVAATAGLLTGTVRGALIAAPNVLAAALIGAFTGLPFAVLWTSAAISFDPAWTIGRWRNEEKKGRVEQSPAVALGGSS